jgi:hypothetical protein
VLERTQLLELLEPLETRRRQARDLAQHAHPVGVETYVPPRAIELPLARQPGRRSIA